MRTVASDPRTAPRYSEADAALPSSLTIAPALLPTRDFWHDAAALSHYLNRSVDIEAQIHGLTVTQAAFPEATQQVLPRQVPLQPQTASQAASIRSNFPRHNGRPLAGSSAAISCLVLRSLIHLCLCAQIGAATRVHR